MTIKDVTVLAPGEEYLKSAEFVRDMSRSRKEAQTLADEARDIVSALTAQERARCSGRHRACWWCG